MFNPPRHGGAAGLNETSPRACARLSFRGGQAALFSCGFLAAGFPARHCRGFREPIPPLNFGFGQRYIVVNIPAAFAEAVENDVVVRRYRVIVGKTEKPSPTLTAQITGVVLNPTWTVPSSIAKTEISAHMRKDPTYLSRMHMEVLDAHDNPIDPQLVDWSRARTRRTSPCASTTAPSTRSAR